MVISLVLLALPNGISSWWQRWTLEWSDFLFSSADSISVIIYFISAMSLLFYLLFSYQYLSISDYYDPSLSYIYVNFSFQLNILPLVNIEEWHKEQAYRFCSFLYRSKLSMWFIAWPLYLLWREFPSRWVAVPPLNDLTMHTDSVYHLYRHFDSQVWCFFPYFRSRDLR